MKKTKENLEELLIDLQEVRAYRSLQKEPFDFGTGLIENTSDESEDACYEMWEQDILDKVEDKINEIRFRELEDVDMEDIVKLKILNKYVYIEPGEEAGTSYSRKREDNERMKYMKYKTLNEETGDWYYKRYYYSDKKKHAKRMSNKKVRKYKPYVGLRGSDYRKIFDYWGNVY